MKTVRTTKPATPEQLRAWLAAGTVEAWEQPQPVPGQPGRYTVRYVVDSQVSAPWAPGSAGEGVGFSDAPSRQGVDSVNTLRRAVSPRPWPVKRRWSRRRKLVVTGVVSSALLGLAVVGYLAALWAAAHAGLLLGIATCVAIMATLLLRRLGGGGDCTVIHIRH